MQTKTIVALAVALLLLATVAAIVASRKTARFPARRLRRLMAQRADYLILVGVPLAKPVTWATATPQREGFLDVPGHGTLRVSDVRAFVVAYPNRQLLDAEPCGLPWPEGLEGLAPAPQAQSDLLSLEDLATGQDYLQITYAPSAARPHDRSHYATTLKNISGERIRVRRFAGYKPNEKGWRLSTVTRQFYSAGEFREWHGLGADEWIEPGQAVTDPNNYGAPPVLWAYYCETASGQQFIAGGSLECRIGESDPSAGMTIELSIDSIPSRSPTTHRPPLSFALHLRRFFREPAFALVDFLSPQLGHPPPRQKKSPRRMARAHGLLNWPVQATRLTPPA